MRNQPTRVDKRAMLMWQITDLLKQLTRAKLWWRTNGQ